MKFSRPRALIALLIVLFVPSLPRASRAPAQFTRAEEPAATLPEPQWEIDAGGAARFDLASVKQNPADGAWHSNVPLTEEGDSTGEDQLLATDVPLNLYIAFAYKVSARQSLQMRSRLPKWALTARFDIEAKAPTQNPTRDQMRLMMQALLAERFHLAVHRESRESPVYELVLDKPGKTGPNLQPNSAGPPCFVAGDADSVPAQKGLPATCGALTPLAPSVPGRMRMGVRGANMEQIAGYLAILGATDRDIVDGTGLPGTFDFSIEWTPDSIGPLPPNFQPDPTGPAFLDAVREQLGLRLRPATGLVEMLVIDRIEQPTPN